MHRSEIRRRLDAAERAQMRHDLVGDLALVEGGFSFLADAPQRRGERRLAEAVAGPRRLAAGPIMLRRLGVVGELLALIGPVRGDARRDPETLLGELDRRAEQLLHRLGAVVDAHHEPAGRVRAPPRPHGLLLLDLAPLVALAGPSLGDAHI